MIGQGCYTLRSGGAALFGAAALTPIRLSVITISSSDYGARCIATD